MTINAVFDIYFRYGALGKGKKGVGDGGRGVMMLHFKAHSC